MLQRGCHVRTTTTFKIAGLGDTNLRLNRGVVTETSTLDSEVGGGRNRGPKGSRADSHDGGHCGW